MMLAVVPAVLGTSSKMDFLPLADVRTDPIVAPPTCLADHVHTFYGATASLRPEMSYDDMLAAKGNSGNVKENKSLYWHPTLYKLNHGTHEKADVWFGTAYYVWKTGGGKGYTKAFPNGFKMIAKGSHAPQKARVRFTCEAPRPCDSTATDCRISGDRIVPPPPCPNTDPSENCFTELPQTACAVMEASIVFPSCWDGNSSDSHNHMDHVAYDAEPGDWFMDSCPASHPHKIPEIHVPTRDPNPRQRSHAKLSLVPPSPSIVLMPWLTWV